MRTKAGYTTRQRHKKVLKAAKGFRGRSKNCYSIAIRRLEKSWQYAYRDRRVRKREFRSLWIQRINAAVRMYGLTYSQFISKVQKAGIELDRKVMADLAMNQPEVFKGIIDKIA